jgi:GDP-4-dehydro-6-deoxy-D-mannose reductase
MSRLSALVTGIAGFAGSYLAEELLAHGYSVTGTVLKEEPLAHIASIRKKISLVTLDITDAKACRRVMNKVKPDYLFHMAAMASVGRSFGTEGLTFRVNVEGTLNLLEACREHGKLKKLILISSADAYGIVKPAGRILKETHPLDPVSPYGISKAAAEQLARYYFRVYGTPVVISRSFNHTGPRQSENFVIPSFSRQIALIELGKQPPALKVGDLSARRDLSDVRDIVRGYRRMAESGRIGEVYQLCSGKAVSIDRMLRQLLALSTRQIEVTVDKNRLRKADIPILTGSNRKAASEFGFAVTIPLRETLAATLDYWRARLDRP